MEAMLQDVMAESAKAQAEAEQAAERDPSMPPPQSQPQAQAPPKPAGPTPEELQRRREALARRLTGGQRPPQPSKPAVSEKPNPLRYSNPQDAMDALKRRYEDRL